MNVAELKALHEKVADRRRHDKELVTCSICGKKISKWSNRGKQEIVECLKCKPSVTAYPNACRYNYGIDNVPYGSLPLELLGYLENALPLYPSNVKYITEKDVKYTSIRILNLLKE